jgi:predicted TIM-barrel fold metal-dependent hydrolase
MKTADLTIVDAHAHVIEHIAGIGRRGESRAVGRGRVRWADGEEMQIVPPGWGETSFTHEQLVREMDDHGVSRAILMQGPFYGFCNDYTFEAQQAHPGRLFGMGTFDPFAGQAPAVMENLIRRFRFRGLKFEISRSFGLMGYHPELRIDAEPMTRIWELAERDSLVVSLDLGTFGEPSFQVKGLRAIAARHPDLRFVVEHVFSPGRDRFDDVRATLGLLAPCDNVSFTLASIPGSTMPERYPFPIACRYAAIAREMVGADRILWGSDIPGTAVNIPYRQLIDWVAESGVFTEEELRKVYAENAIQVYRLQI